MIQYLSSDYYFGYAHFVKLKYITISKQIIHVMLQMYNDAYFFLPSLLNLFYHVTSPSFYIMRYKSKYCLKHIDTQNTIIHP